MLDAHQKAEAQARAELRQRIDAVLTDEQRQRRDEQRQARAERRLDRLADRLDLSDTQREEVAAIFAQKRKNPQMTRSEVRNALAGVLTEEQIARLDALRDRHQSARHGGRGGDFPDRR